MAKLTMIDCSKPLSLEPNTLGALTDPDLRRQAVALSLPQLLNIDAATPDAQPLHIAETGALIDWLLSTPWGSILEADLQSMAEDGDGRPLLTTWLNAREFALLVNDADGQPFAPCFKAAYEAWIGLGMTSVYIHGHERARAPSSTMS